MRLFKHKGYYPIDIEPRTNKPSLNKKIYIAALHHFLYKVEDRLAAMDLVYLREDNLNHLGDILEPEDREEYEKLIEKYNLEDFRRDFSRETTSLLKNVSRIVNDLGLTLQGMKFEVLLHDVRNPLRSIIAAQNSQEVSGRKLYDPSTRFVVQYLRHQGEHLLALENTSKVSYLKQFLKNKKVKATTTPIFDERYGLIGILCFNIDVEAVHKFSKEEKERFFENYTRTFGETPEFEKEIAPG